MKIPLLSTMWVWATLLMLTCCPIRASAQQYQVTLTLQDVPLEQVIDAIKRQTNVSFLYNAALLRNVGRVSVSAVNEPMEQVLRSVLINTGLTFDFQDNAVVIKRTQRDSGQPSVRVSGVIYDEKGAPIPGVTVALKNALQGVSSDAQGRFTLQVQQQPPFTLVASILGYKREEVEIQSPATPLDIHMTVDVQSLDDIIVTGYNYIDKSNFTGSAVTITREELLKVSPTNILRSLQIFDPSFKMLDNNELGSDPNNINSVYIRGRSGISDVALPDDEAALSETQLRNDPNLPTFIIDGYEVPVQRVFDLDPTRVESISILKDAASTAIYGSRAANGVVVIETVKPVDGRLRIHYSLNGSVSAPDLSGYHLLNARDKLELERIAGLFVPRANENPNLALDREQSYYDKLAEINRGVETDWLSQPLQTALNHRHNILLEGGSKEFIFGTDLNFARTDGVMKGSARNTNAIGFSLSYRKNRLMFRNYIQWNNTQSNESPFGAFATYAEKNPYDTFLDEEGNYRKTMTQWFDHRGINGNPLYDAHLKSYNQTNQNEFINNFNLRWTILDNLRLDTRFALAQRKSQLQDFKDPASSTFDQLDFDQKGTKRILDDQLNTWDFNTLLLYGQSLGKHHVNMTLGANATEKDQNRSGYTVRGFLSGNTDDVNFAADILNKPTGDSEKSRLLGFLASANYTFNNIYLLDFSGRYDGASQFGSNVRFAPFWSVGAGVNVHNYKGMRDRFPWLTNFKLRTNYGQVGKAGFSQSVSKSTYRYNFDQWYVSGIGASIISLANPNLEWEKTKMFDAGFDLAVFNKLNFTANYYHKKTIDLIGDITLPLSTGFSAFKSNLGEILNEGFEVSTQYQALATRSLSLNVYATLAHNTNRFLKIDNALQEYNLRVEEYYRSHSVVNKPLNKYYEGASQTAIYAMNSLGINPADGKEVFLMRDGVPTYEWHQTEHIVVGDTEPDFRGSFGLNFSYKSFFIFAGFIYEYGGEMYNATLVNKVENASIFKNVDHRVFTDRWRQPGDITHLKDVSEWNEVTQVSSRFVQKNNYVDFNSVTLGYSLPQQLVHKWRLSMCKVQLTANDLGRISTIDTERGTTYPYARTVNMTLNVSF
ncbi:SusC/RagA family TonB-linked outer membrane protein [Parapedobacter tibetensis]|uniref:SusC/RagA family TonB-linked outer membrane protein n=1 Tax=Parapedobacter tibetensis TaxID=2972951 RepID=UPI00214DACFC|nr:SusC/RagA family TonB-linked outer membrane protein [Parapedobacter tibetensis]